jgi:UDP:flavonoid glycosyltransferase YjiC (YdhE family)
MRLLFTTLREKSHFLPLTPFIEACHRQGHEVAVSAPPDFGEQVAKTGAEFLPFGHPGDEGLKPIWGRMREASREEGTRIAAGELFAGACAGAAIPGLIEILGRFRPAFVLRESLEFAAAVAAEKMGIPHVRVAICAQGAESELLGFAAPWVDAHRRAVGLRPDPAGDRIRDEPVVTLFPPSFEPNEVAPRRILRFRGPRAEPPPLPDWWAGRQGPFVYATLGTVTGGFDTMRAVYRRVLDVLVDMPVRALLTIGSSLPMETLGEIPGNVHVERFVPQESVLPHAAAVFGHGGSGTVIGALAAGVPQVVAPMFADQPYNAARVAAIGAGLAVPSLETGSSEVRNALERVIHEASFRTAAQAMAREIAGLPLVDDVVGKLASLVGS